MLAVFDKGLRDHNSPICTLSQNGYGDQRAKARKYMRLLTFWAVPSNTHPALCRLSSEVGRDPAHSTRCGRQRPRWVEVERDPAHSTWYGRQRRGWVWVGPRLARAPQRFAKFPSRNDPSSWALQKNLWSRGYDVSLTRSRSPARSWLGVLEDIETVGAH